MDTPQKQSWKPGVHQCIQKQLLTFFNLKLVNISFHSEIAFHGFWSLHWCPHDLKVTFNWTYQFSPVFTLFWVTSGISRWLKFVKNCFFFKHSQQSLHEINNSYICKVTKISITTKIMFSVFHQPICRMKWYVSFSTFDFIVILTWCQHQ